MKTTVESVKCGVMTAPKRRKKMTAKEEREKRLLEIEKEMMAASDMCRMWSNSKDGSHGACLAANGFFKLRQEKEALELEEVLNG
jgi:hypothetical protein